MNASSMHMSVMLSEVLEALSPQDGGVYVDGTLGAGGYAEAILSTASCQVCGIDRDDTAHKIAAKRLSVFGKRFVPLKGCFGDVRALLGQENIQQVDGFVLDLGVSSMQLDQAERGFSFREEGPLDMRMSQNGDDETAADIVNTRSAEALADILYLYGEERKSRRIARAIVEERAKYPFETTAQLADLIRRVIKKSPKDKIDPATRSFQALRIAVNKELEELERALEASLCILKEGGRLVVVTFHSLEDRIVKNFFREKTGRGAPSISRHGPEQLMQDQAEEAVYFACPDRKAILPHDHEIELNSRSRSAKLRWGIRTALPYKEGGV